MLSSFIDVQKGNSLTYEIDVAKGMKITVNNGPGLVDLLQKASISASEVWPWVSSDGLFCELARVAVDHVDPPNLGDLVILPDKGYGIALAYGFTRCQHDVVKEVGLSLDLSVLDVYTVRGKSASIIDISGQGRLTTTHGTMSYNDTALERFHNK